MFRFPLLQSSFIVQSQPLCAEQHRKGQQDEALAAGTRLRVPTHGEGVYERFEVGWVGTNNHYIRFDSGGSKKVALKKLRPQDWAVLALPAEQVAEIEQKVKRQQRRDTLHLPHTATDAECETAETRRDMLRLPHTATNAECKAALLEERKQGTAEQKKLEKAAEAAGTQVSLPACATACAAFHFPHIARKTPKSAKMVQNALFPCETEKSQPPYT
eukprot:COSAG06_NODE_2312_length_7100_cov_7.782609_10_plen_216_part_00